VSNPTAGDKHFFSAQANETLQKLNPYKPPVTCDNHEEIRKSPVFGPTCDALDVVSMAENLPGDLLYSEQIGACSHASSTYFNGFPPANVVPVNQ
jgi:ornithine decarboxylase